VFNHSPLLQRLEKQGLFKLNGKGNGDREKAKKIQLLQSKIHKALKSGSMSLYKPTTKQDWINYLT